MTVPEHSFDVSPGKVRDSASPYHHWMRFSFGSPSDNVAMSLDRLEAMLKNA